MQLDDDTFLARFRNQTLSPEQFSHRAHLRMAWLYLNRHPVAEACARMCADTRAFAESLGAPGKYHHTVTEALMRIVDHRMYGADAGHFDTFDAFLAANPDLQADALGLLARHYSDGRLDCEKARTGWVAPDLEPFGRAD